MIHIGPIDIRTDIFVLILAVILLFIQLLICFKSNKKSLRLIPIILFFTLTLAFLFLAFIFDGWDRVGYLLLAACSGCMSLICGIGWGIWRFVNLKCRGKK